MRKFWGAWLNYGFWLLKEQIIKAKGKNIYDKEMLSREKEAEEEEKWGGVRREGGGAVASTEIDVSWCYSSKLREEEK